LGARWRIQDNAERLVRCAIDKSDLTLGVFADGTFIDVLNGAIDKVAWRYAKVCDIRLKDVSR
jgi:hypothetical protein